MITPRQAKQLTRRSIKRGLLPRPERASRERTARLLRDRHAAYMRGWRIRHQKEIEQRQLKLFPQGKDTCNW